MRIRKVSAVSGRAWLLPVYALVLAFGAGFGIHRLHQGLHERNEIAPVLHWLRDSALGIPAALVAVYVAGAVVRRLAIRRGACSDGSTRAVWILTAAAAYALAAIPGNELHRILFVGEGLGHGGQSGWFTHALHDSAAVLGFSAGTLLVCAVLVGLPVERRSPLRQALRVLARIGARRLVSGAFTQRRALAAIASVGLALAVGAAVTPAVGRAVGIGSNATSDGCAAFSGTRTIVADIVAIDQSISFNRLGADNPEGIVFALRSDVVARSGTAPLGPGNAHLRSGKRPRPITLRVNVGDCLRIRFENLLAPVAKSNQPADRHVGIHINGMQLADPDGAGSLESIDSSGSYVGRNKSSLAAPGEKREYLLFAEYENTFLLSDAGVTAGAEANGGTTSFGLFGAVNVEPFGTEWYRSQLSRAEMDLATRGSTPDGHPVLDYDARYPTDESVLSDLRIDKELAGSPILRMLDGNQLVHADLNAIIAGAPENGFAIPKRAYPASYWQNEMIQQRQDRGTQPFREFTTVFHDEVHSRQAFPEFFDDPKLGFTLHGVKQGFAINYGMDAVGAEVIANRLGVGPMGNCEDCKYEEFFLSAWTVGDPAMVIDKPSYDQATGKAGLHHDARVLYPDDPSNVHRSYLNDRVKIRNLHAGPKEHHIFHLHAHQWQYDWNAEKSSYLDSQNIGPGSGFTYEIAYGGSGNRNKTVGDSIFHCHFYPHFAQGMWSMWRVHDTFENGTKLDRDGRPQKGSRAQPDGEIVAGTPIPAVVPLPGRPMAPMPAAGVTVVPYPATGVATTSQVDADGNTIADMDEGWVYGTTLGDDVESGSNTILVESNAGIAVGDLVTIGLEKPADRHEILAVDGAKVTLDGVLLRAHSAGDPVTRADNPGFPFFIPGVAGHRAPTPPMDIAIEDGKRLDGGLRRHVIVDGEVEQFQTRLDFNKKLLKATALYIPEEGTPAERAAMDFHATQWHPTYTSTGKPVNATTPLAAGSLEQLGQVGIQGFETNGLAPEQGAPFADPCRSDLTSGPAQKIGTPRTYRGSVIQLDLTMNKAGWHYPQQRIFSLDGDVQANLSGTRAPEPLVMRLGVGDCATYQHTNLTPNVYELDDYQVKTPTDVIGQHIHLVKFDVMTADGSANGYNYEDGTFSPEEVVERIEAIRHATEEKTGEPCPNGADPYEDEPGQEPTDACPLAVAHPRFKDIPTGLGESTGGTVKAPHLAWGARTTVQRWYADKLLNNAWDSGLGTVFTHDHYGPSTHQQNGLYGTVLVEPERSIWRDPVSGVCMGTSMSVPGICTAPAGRLDGGPTSWQADIITDPVDKSFREFYLEFADFQQAYQKGGGQKRTQSNEDPLNPKTIVSYSDYLKAINPPYRQQPPAGREKDLFLIPPYCPNVVGADEAAGKEGENLRNLPRPCPEAIAADDPGTIVVNYRNEPIGLRVFDPATKGQTAGDAGDLALAFQSRTDRALGPLNAQTSPYPPLTPGVEPGDPFTPLLRAYMGDKVRIRLQVGAHEHEHTFSMNGVKWLQEPMNPASGWRDSQAAGISEYFNAEAPLVPDITTGNTTKNADYLYKIGTSAEDLWTGIWGLMRAYGKRQPDLLALPNNQIPQKGWRVKNLNEFDRVCPRTVNGAPAQTRSYNVTAVRAIDVLGPNGLPYNDRVSKRKLVDPTALLYVYSDDIVRGAGGKPVGLKPGAPLEPLVLRAAAGDCIRVTLENALPKDILAGTEAKPGFNALHPVVAKDTVDVGSPFGPGVVTFNANDLTPSSRIGLHPQLLEYDITRDNGIDIGANRSRTIEPGERRVLTWFAGDLQMTDDPASPGNKIVKASPIEFGAVGLMPADSILGSNRGLVGSLIVEPYGATWITDPGTRVSATVTAPGGKTFREFVTVVQDDLNLRQTDCVPSAANLSCAVRNITGEGPGFPEDALDTGQKAINYLSDPIWFRLGIAPETPFTGDALRKNDKVHMAFSNDLVGGDPKAPVFKASLAPTAPQAVRMRVVQPGGHNRGHVFTVHGHVWQRQPYLQRGDVASDMLTYEFVPDPTCLDTGSGCTIPAGANTTGWWTSSQESVSAGAHFDLQFKSRGGHFSAPGDYLFRDASSFGAYQGLWGILRVGENEPVPAADAYFVPVNGKLLVAQADGVLRNDFDADGQKVSVDAGSTKPNSLTEMGGRVSMASDGSFVYTAPKGFGGTDAFSYRLVGASSSVRVTVTVMSKSPVAVADWAVVSTAGTNLGVTIPVLQNDTDPDRGTALRIAADAVSGEPLVTRPANVKALGAVTFDATRTALVYLPSSAGVSGRDTFFYSVDDGTGNLATAAVNVTITGADIGSVTVRRMELALNNKTWSMEGTAGPALGTATVEPAAVAVSIGGKQVVRIPVVKGGTAAEPTWSWSFTGLAPNTPAKCSSVTVGVVLANGAAGASLPAVPMTCIAVADIGTVAVSRMELASNTKVWRMEGTAAPAGRVGSPEPVAVVVSAAGKQVVRIPVVKGGTESAPTWTWSFAGKAPNTPAACGTVSVSVVLAGNLTGANQPAVPVSCAPELGSIVVDRMALALKQKVWTMAGSAAPARAAAAAEPAAVVVLVNRKQVVRIPVVKRSTASGTAWTWAFTGKAPNTPAVCGSVAVQLELAGGIAGANLPTVGMTCA